MHHTLSRRALATLGLGACYWLASAQAQAACIYTIENQWADGFTASITLTNDTGRPLNGWTLNWNYANNRLVSGWNSELSGSQAISARNLGWNGNLAPGQSLSFGVQGSKQGAAERPQITGSACLMAGATSSAPALPPSSAASSSAPAAANLVLQEAAAGFCRVDGSIDTNHSGFTGAGFANGDNRAGAAVIWAVTAAGSSRHNLRLRFANGGTQPRAAHLLINQGTNGNYSIEFPVTGGWNQWQTIEVPVDLSAGNNLINLSARGDEGLANIDSLGVSGAGPLSAGICAGIAASSSAATSSTPPTSSTGATSTGASSSAPSAPTCPLTPPFKWTSTAPLISPKNAGWASVKDPSIVKHNGEYHVYATTYFNNSWRSMYTHFSDWDSAPQAAHIPMEGTRVGNTIAPQVFFFRPHNKWYLITQWGGAYATTDDISKPESWSARKKLLQGEPAGALDFWVICNDSHCYLYFSRDDGKLYMSKTTLGNFPNFSGYSVVMEDHRGDGKSFLFEAANVYKLDGQNRYLLLVEAYRTPGYGSRYFRSWTAASLDGPWSALADTETHPFAGNNNVSWPGGKWANGISHGELVRSGIDERLTVDPCNLEFLYQGESGPGATYGTIPYKLGLLRLVR